MMKDFHPLHISSGTLVRFFAIILGAAVIYIIRDIIIALFFAVIVASAIEPAIEWLKERKMPRIPSVILIYLAIALAVFSAIYLFFPLLFEEFKTVSLDFPNLQKQFMSGVEQVESLPLSSYLAPNFEQIFRTVTDFTGKISGGIFNFASAIFGGLFSFFLVVIFSFYLAIQEKGIESFLKLLAPLDYELYVIDLWERSQKKLGRWFRTQMLLGALIGVLIFFGLTILGVKNALFFAMLAAVFEIIPIAGPILAAVPAVIVAFFSSPLLGVFTILLYVVVQQTESHVIIPVVMRKTIGLSPLVVVLALLIGGKIGGISGILLSVPVTVILAELLNDWNKKKRALIPE